MKNKNRGEILLDFICEEIDQRLNPEGEDCPECGGEGFVYFHVSMIMET